MPFDWFQLLGLVGIGLVAGVIGGLLGVGGSIIMIPGMAFVLPPDKRHPEYGQHLYQAAAMIVNIFVAAPAAVRHWTAGAVVRPVIRWLVPGAVAGVIMGVSLSNVGFFKGDNADRLGKVFALFLAYVTIYNLYRLIRGNRMADPTQEQLRALGAWRITVVGCGMGLAAGLTGIGGGALAVPMQQVFLKMPLKRAIANSACTIVFSAIVGSIYKNATLMSEHHIAVWHSGLVAAMLIPSAFIGGWVGANLTHRLPRQPVRILFILLLMVGVWRMWTAKSSVAADSGGSVSQKQAAAGSATQPESHIVTTHPAPATEP